MTSADTDLPPNSASLAIVDGGEFSLPRTQDLTLGAALLETARVYGDRGVCYLTADAFREQTYPALLEDAARILTGLRQFGLSAGAPVLFQLAQNEDFIPAFWACVLGGFVPVPVPIASDYDQPNAGTAKLVAAWSLLGQPVTIAGATLAEKIGAFAANQDLAGLRGLAIERLRDNPAATTFHVSAPDDTALLLLTSGSTGVPKAVRQTHRNLISWAFSYCRCTAITSRDVCLNWMPLDHVGGIVMSVIRDTVIGARQLHAATEIPLRRPLIWLDWIDRFHVTVTWGPNFVFGLVNECAEEIATGHWDLSPLRLLLNGGEAVVARTARRFLTLLIPHGLSPDSMVPIWGMSETASGTILSRRFRLDTTSDDDSFVEVGVPLPGLQVRITDSQHRTLAAGAIGQMQIRGISITPGYEHNEEANGRSFSPDGWFMTGDLAIIRDGQLTIVGREKDAIIVNGVNFYSHEIEAFAEEVDGVAVSFTAACAVRTPGDDSDRLALFFSPADPAWLQADGPAMPQLMHALRRAVVDGAGIMPDFVVPVAAEAIPKTSLGKIQRNLLKERFEAGAFAATLARSAGAPPRVPLFERFWRPAPIDGLPPADLALPAGARVLMFTDASEFGNHLIERIGAAGHSCLTVRAGSAFPPAGPGAVTLDPLQDHTALFRHLASIGFVPTHVVHAWAYPVRAPGDPCTGLAETQAASLSLLRFLRAFPTPEPGRIVRLLVVSSQLLSDTVPADFAKASLLGLVHTIRHELDWLEAGLLDFTTPDPAQDVTSVLQELAVLAPEARIENGIRAVPLIRYAAAGTSAVPLISEAGFTIVSGGTGGIGTLLVRQLADAGARVLVIGRHATAAPEDSVMYAAGDIADPAFVGATVRAAVERWQATPAAVFHLAGSYHECDLVRETDDALLAGMAPKLAGAWALHQAVSAYPDCRFVAFSSLLAQFGAMSTGAYAAANAGLDAFARHLRALGRDAQTILWSSWSGTGMAAFANAEALRVRGFLPFSPAENMRLLEQALACTATPILVGLDTGNRAMREHLDSASVQHGPAKVGTGFVAPRNPVEARLARLWCNLLGLPQVDVTSNFFDLGGRSLLAARLFGQIEKEFGHSLPLATLYKAPTIEALAALLAPSAEPRPRPAIGGVELHAVQPNGDRPPFFCIPGVGSDVIAFQDLARELGPEQPFYGLQLRGLDGARIEGPAPEIVDVAQGFIGLMRETQPVGPYFVGGHCFGSLLAWEVARQLRSQGDKVGLLVLLDPVVSNEFPADVIQEARLRYSLQKFRSLSIAGKIRYGLEKLQGLRRIRLVRERLGSSIEQARAMHAGYRIEDYPGDLVVMLADDSFLNMAPERDPRRYYGRFARDTKYLSVPGNHDTILHAPGVQELATRLQASLREAAMG